MHIMGLIYNQSLMNDNTQENKIGNYLLGAVISQGVSSKVQLATHILTDEKVAIKIFFKEKLINTVDVERVSREIHILKLIRHPYIIQFYEVIQTSSHLFLVMEYIENQQLFDYIVKNTTINEKEACKYFKQLLSGVAYLHQLNITHRDLKPENLLIDWKRSLKIVDFDSSNTYSKGQKLKTACGSPCYAAPQMIASKKYHGLQVDIWSCGVILFAMVCGYLPFQDSNTSQLYKKILSGQYVLPNFVSDDFKDLLEKILNVDPAKRYSIEEIYSHRWCQQVSDIPLNSGIIVGYHRMPMDMTILNKLKQFDFNIEYCTQCIQTNRHNNITTTYYLLLKKHLKRGQESSADLSWPYFDYSAVEPLKRVYKKEQAEINNDTLFDDMSVCRLEINDNCYQCLNGEVENNPQIFDEEQEIKVTQKTTQEQQLSNNIQSSPEYYQEIPQTNNPQLKSPQTKVKCGKCMTPQMIPSTTDKFICYSCCQICRLPAPKYKAFICGNCKIKVLYRPGVSKYIKCIKCSTVNMIQ